jgi:hypothetical protein
MTDKCCIHCKYFRDGNFNQYTYISPECTQRGQDSAAFMREFICGLDGRLFEPKSVENHSHLESSRSKVDAQP